MLAIISLSLRIVIFFFFWVEGLHIEFHFLIGENWCDAGGWRSGERISWKKNAIFFYPCPYTGYTCVLPKRYRRILHVHIKPYIIQGGGVTMGTAIKHGQT